MSETLWCEDADKPVGIGLAVVAKLYIRCI